MRDLIKKRFNIDFKGGNPFYFLIKAQAKARIKPKMGHLSARCFGGCGRLIDGYNLVSRRFTPHNMCISCFSKRKPGIILQNLILDCRVTSSNSIEFMQPNKYV